MLIFTFSNQAFNESLDLCNRLQPRERHTFDLQLPSSIASANTQEVILVL